MRKTVIAFIVLPMLGWATDQGPRDSTSPGTNPVSVQPGPPSRPEPVPGPLPSEKKVPASAPKEGSGLSSGDALQQRLDAIDKELSKPHLSAKKRRRLEAERTDLQTKALVTSPAPGSTPR